VQAAYIGLMPLTKFICIGWIGLIVFDPLNPSSQALSAEFSQISIAIHSRKVDPSQKTIRVTQGQTLDLTFTADEMVELHLHGYDRFLIVEPGSVAVMRLHANTAGRFAIEGHRFGSGAGSSRSRRHVVLLYLEVHPQ
jgi:Multicopper oxidase